MYAFDIVSVHESWNSNFSLVVYACVFVCVDLCIVNVSAFLCLSMSISILFLHYSFRCCLLNNFDIIVERFVFLASGGDFVWGKMRTVRHLCLWVELKIAHSRYMHFLTEVWYLSPFLCSYKQNCSQSLRWCSCSFRFIFFFHSSISIIHVTNV